MTLTIELPDDLEAVLKAQAEAKGVSASGFVRSILEEALAHGAGPMAMPRKSAYGLLARFGPGPSEEDIDENRREMFRGFAEDAP